MALVLKDRVRETTTVLGTADATLLGAVTGYQAFSVIGNTNTCYYTIADGSGNWEVGLGTYSSVGPTLARTTIIASSNSGNKVNFQAGTKDVFVTYPAEYAAYVDGSNIVPGTASTVPTTYGGTGLSSYSAGDLPYYSAGTALSKLGIGTNGYVLKSTGSAPAWEQMSNLAVTTISFDTTGLTPSTATGGAVTVGGTLVVANGGTGKTTAPAAFANLLGWTTTATAAATTTLTAASTVQQEFTGSTTQTVVLPDVTTLALGWTYDIINNSTGNLTINSSGGNLVGTVTSGTIANVVCVLTTGTTAASWNFDIGGFSVQTGTGSVVRGTSPAFTTSVVGGATFAAFNTTTTTLSMAGAATTLNMGGSTANTTYNFASGATLSGNTKTVNIGNAGVSGSTTNINIGSSVSGAGGTTTINGTVALQNALPITSGGTGATTVSAAQTNLQVDPAGTAIAMSIALG